jgi:hypothetical protein
VPRCSRVPCCSHVPRCMLHAGWGVPRRKCAELRPLPRHT